ncbi:MAG: DUF4290 domain-containing protein [Bacteroidales bacterium]|nr:DUF4290 domain-containing protein [Bacteroidales bacterium]MCF8350171.1 DUF4290 domain-containing protein [Bacteroidales bacterium]MCF8375060.1 DUF4290 domain-containing protein [Bacteroidales bacterium]MCF8399966.1 DUF4290 domain-containing protein [Bacteroidales bacterium]
MEYNSTRDKLIIPEYGRNVQKLIKFTMDMKDRDERTRMAHLIVSIMAQMNPTVKETSDYKRKLWDHMYFISDFKLEVDSPYPKPSADILTEKPKPLGYKEGDPKFRHYGKNVEKLIKAAVDFEDGEVKDALVMTIANHMKKAYLAWNRESVSDELIEDHLKSLSGGRLELKEDQQLNSTSDILAKTRKKKFVKKEQHHQQRGRRDHQQNSNYNRRRRINN